MLIFEQFHTPGIAQLSYLIGDDSKGVAAVIDPRPDIDCYLEKAQEYRVGITHIFETHIHADFLSGSLELQRRLGTPKIFASGAGGWHHYGFDCEKVKDGDMFEFGDNVITVRHTPGHTREHISFVVAEKKRKNSPWGVFSGDSLFADSAGRPDIVGGEKEARELSEQMFEMLTGFYMKLDDGVTIFPGHGAGSSCGPDIGDRRSTTIGYERKHNPFFQFHEKEEFIQYVKSTATPIPTYYAPMKKLNRKGPPTFGAMPTVPPLPPKSFKEAMKERGTVLIDTRTMLGFGGGHIKGALNIGARPELSPWAGWMVKFDDPLLLVLEHDEQLEKVVKYLWRVGMTKFAGYLVGGMKAWDNQGFEIEPVQQMTVHELKAQNDGIQIVDVRAPDEWESGHIPGARHFFVPDLCDNLDKFDRNKPVVAYCDSGYRASLAASIFKREGFENVFNVPGSWQAWKHAGYPVEGKMN
jgi:hydroxyacylglutathione hydrolase